MEQNIILPISERGQITIPKKFRTRVGARFVICSMDKGSIVLSPMQTRDEFINELEEAHEDWKKNGGKTLHGMKEEYDL